MVVIILPPKAAAVNLKNQFGGGRKSIFCPLLRFAATPSAKPYFCPHNKCSCAIQTIKSKLPATEQPSDCNNPNEHYKNYFLREIFYIT